MFWHEIAWISYISALYNSYLKIQIAMTCNNNNTLLLFILPVSFYPQSATPMSCNN